MGTILSGIGSRYFGRKRTLMMTQTVALLALMVLRFAYIIPMFYLGSFLGGCTGGIVNAVIPTYVAEINQPRIRKFTGSFINVGFAFGFVYTKFVGVFSNWRDTVSCMFALPILGFILFIFCPESPSWYISKGREDIAALTMKTLRGNEVAANGEITRIKENLERQQRINKGVSEKSYIRSQINIVTKGTFIRPCLVVTIMMSIFWQWSGGRHLIFYTDDILNTFKIPISPTWMAAAIGGYQFMVALLGIFLSSVIPRRVYYMGSGALLCLGNVILGVSVHLLRYEFFVNFLKVNDGMKWLPVCGFLIYFLGYQLGFMSVGFMLLGEILPSNGKEIGGCIIIQCMNVSFFLSLKSSNWMQNIMGLDGLFCLFAVVAFASIIFAYFVIPETFGKTLEEMEDHYRKICYSPVYKPSVPATEVINMSFVSDNGLTLDHK